MRASAALLPLALCSACATPGPIPPGLAPNPATCAPVVERAAAGEDSARVEPASFTSVLIPPLPPAQLRGTRLAIRVRVDERGVPDAENAVIEGSTDERYDAALRESLRGYLFVPARLDGCRVPSTFRFVVDV